MKGTVLVFLFQLAVCVITPCVSQEADETGYDLTVGLITPVDNTLMGYGRVAAAVTMAVEKAKKDGHIKNINVR